MPPRKRRSMQPAPRRSGGLVFDMIRPTRDEFVLVCLLLPVLLSAAMAGGSAWPRHVGDVLVEICAVPLIVHLGLAMRFDDDRSIGSRLELIVPGLAVGLLLVQLIPLPPSLWSHFPSHAQISVVDDIIDRPPVSMPISLNPALTFAAIGYLLPPLAVFFAVRSLGRSARRLVVALVVAAAVVNMIVALAQGAFGPQSLWNVYGTASVSASNGLFKSQNHYAALEYAAIPYVFAFARDVRDSRPEWRFSAFVIGSIVVAVLFLGGLLSHSRAGMTGVALALGLSALITLRPGRHGARWRLPRWILIVPLLLLLLAVDREFARIAQRASEHPIDDLRGRIYVTSLDAIWANWPWGTGFGSFVDVYEKFEKSDLVVPSFINFAHNDYLQILLEGGIFGALVVGAFFIWYAVRVGTLVRPRPSGGRRDPYVVASLIVSSLLLLHSVVDYPLRNGELACVFAIACAFVSRPQAAVSSSRGHSARPVVPYDADGAHQETVPNSTSARAAT